LSKAKFLSNKEYLLGDSAFSASSVMVPAFKKGQNANFNKKLAKVRIKSEHCIRLIKELSFNSPDDYVCMHLAQPFD